jgi:hypothetical protein
LAAIRGSFQHATQHSLHITNLHPNIRIALLGAPFVSISWLYILPFHIVSEAFSGDVIEKSIAGGKYDLTMSIQGGLSVPLGVAIRSSPGDFPFWISIVAVIQKYHFHHNNSPFLLTLGHVYSL